MKLRDFMRILLVGIGVSLSGALEAKWTASWEGGWYLILSDGTWKIKCYRETTTDLDGTTYESPHKFHQIIEYPEGGGDLDMSTLWEDILEDRPTWTIANAPVGMQGNFYKQLQSKNVTSVKFPSCLRVISGWSASGSTPVYNSVTTNIVCNQGLNSIRGGFFSYMTNLVTVSGLDTVRHLGSSAFKGCIRLRSIDPYLPSGIETIEADAFYGCAELTGELCYRSPEYLNVNVIPGHPSTISFNDAITNISINFAFAGLESVGKFPASLQRVNACFSDWNFKGTESLPLTADFSSCTNLTSLPEQFAAGSKQLRSLILPPRISSIGNLAMSFCINLTNVDFVADMRFKREMVDTDGSVGSNAFRFCCRLTSVVLPWGGRTIIGQAPFASSPDLKRLKFEGRAPTVDDVYGMFYRLDENLSYNPPGNYQATIYASPKRGRRAWRAFATREPTDDEKSKPSYPGDNAFGVYVSEGKGYGGRTQWLAWETGIWDDVESGLVIIFK